MMLAKRPGCTALSHVSMQCPFDLMMTQNLYSGDPTWTNLTANANGKVAGFVDFDWGANLCPDNNCGKELVTKDENVLATYYANPGDYDTPWDPDVHFIVSDNFFKDFAIHVKCGNQFEVVGRTVYLAFANACPTDVNGKPQTEPSKFPGGITLFTSTDGGNTFVQGCLPIALKQEGYELMETQDGTGVVLVVDYLVKTSIMDIPASSVFMSGPHHALFSLSLADVYHADFGFTTDFSKIEGLPGLFIANQMRSKSGKPDDFDIADLLGFPLVKTRISFNGGGQWENLQAPAKFNNPICNKQGAVQLGPGGMLAGHHPDRGPVCRQHQVIWSGNMKPGAQADAAGRKSTFQRRKPQAMCYYGADYKRPPPKVTPCACTELDTACDYGYWKNDDGKCVAVPSTSMPKCPTVEEHQYQVSSTGLRVLHNDQCEGLDRVIQDTDGQGHALSPSGGGDKPKPAPAPTPSGGGGEGGDSPSPSKSGSKKVQRDMVRDVCAAAAAGLRNAWFWLVERIGSLRSRFGGGSAAPMEQDLGYFQPLGDANDARTMQPRV
ncbi:hypothetical protein DUNSADRAFT_3769 [Dunaliella salina]|uniref:Uncharacterized protein n=1 Tax=Dunaliella salina TaxID=3046 RepID=A0ABQ7GTE7_DUNSA|nr:hypothetical protein DUNSADRAFT_3769 [Dunaliella salina]|eukprot:KAF5837876.1 hypothetical protein DUNSADRAFT_3769 [Dunaliella salina]